MARPGYGPPPDQPPGYPPPTYGASGPPPAYEPPGPPPTYGAPGRPPPAAPVHGRPAGSPFGPSSLLQDRGTAATAGVLALSALLSLVYAGWAFTARRGIFADFSHGVGVTNAQATSSDRLDTALLLVASLLAVAALALWVTRTVNAGKVEGGLELGGFALTGLGVVVVLIGLYVSSTIVGAGDRVSQGDRGVTATVVTGAGFLIIATGLALGALAVWSGRGHPHGGHAGGHRPFGASGHPHA